MARERQRSVPRHGLERRPDHHVPGRRQEQPLLPAVPADRLHRARRGEACAPRWGGIVFAAGRIEITQQIGQYGWATDIQDETKSANGDRVVIAVKPVLRALAKHRRNQADQKAAAAGTWIEAGLVFTTETGTPIHPAHVTDALRAIAARAGLPPIRLHDLRHGTATHALSAGVDMKIVSDLLGHSSITITADTYTSVVDELKRAAADKIADQLALEDDEDEGDEATQTEAA